MGRTLNLKSQEGLDKRSWLYTRQERKRYNAMVARLLKDIPKPTLFQELTAQQIIELRIMIQRLLDRRTYFFGEPTDYVKVDDHHSEIDDEDQKRKEREWEAKYVPLQKELREWLKLAQANKIEISGDFDIASLVNAYRERAGENGEGSEHTKRASRIS